MTEQTITIKAHGISSGDIIQYAIATLKQITMPENKNILITLISDSKGNISVGYSEI